MAKSRKRLTPVRAGQEELFGAEPESFDVSDHFRGEMKRAIRGCSLSRYEIASKMSELLGRDITKTMLDAWLAESKEWRNIKAIDLNAFCEVTGTLDPFRALLRPTGADVVEGKDRDRLELVRIQEKRKKMEAKEAELRRRLRL